MHSQLFHSGLPIVLGSRVGVEPQAHGEAAASGEDPDRTSERSESVAQDDPSDPKPKSRNLPGWLAYLVAVLVSAELTC